MVLKAIFSKKNLNVENPVWHKIVFSTVFEPFELKTEGGAASFSF